MRKRDRYALIGRILIAFSIIISTIVISIQLNNIYMALREIGTNIFIK